MSRHLFYHMKNMLLVFLTTISALTVMPVKGYECKRRICYYDSYAQFRNTAKAQFLPKDIDTRLCSHIIYLTSWLTDSGLTPRYSEDVGRYKQITSLKQGYNDVKVLLALHLKPLDNAAFFTMADSESSRRQFAVKAIQFLRAHRFDGLDVQFYVHTSNPGPAKTKERVLRFLETLRQTFDSTGIGHGKLLLSISVYGEEILNDIIYDIPKISRNVDWITLLAYDFHGYWRGRTGHHTPLYADPNDPGGHSAKYNVDSAVRYWIDRGATKDKIVVAIPLFARPYVLSSNNTGVGAPIKDIFSSSFTQTYNTISYAEICERRDRMPFGYHYLRKQGATYLVSENLWITYDDLNSLTQKVRYIKEKGLGGFAADSVDFDDFTGYFCRMGPFPLLKAANLACTGYLPYKN